MFRYILTLLLISASYRSLGNPINPNTPVSLLNSLTALANDCENVFLSNQIKDKTLSCSTLPSLQGEKQTKQLQCLVFYDINKQVCEAISADKLALPEEDYTAKINEEQDVNSLCVLAKDWVFSNLTEFSRYKQAVGKVFKHPISCGKICGVEDFMSDDANYFCKYFKWGTDLLKQAISTSTQNVISNAQQQEATNVNKDESALASNDLQDVQIKDTSSTNAKIDNPTNISASGKQPKVELVKPETTSLAGNQKSQSVDPGTISNVGAVPEVQANVDAGADNVEDTGAMPDNTLGDQHKSTEGVALKVESAQGSVTKAKAEDTQNKPEGVEKSEDTNELQQLNNELDNKQPVLETPKGKVPPGEVEDYPDAEEGKEGLSDMQGGDDSDEPVIEPEDQRPAQKAETVESTFNRDKEPFYANPVQGAFPEDDDHFLSFFLTAVILVVLLYVLYHNKNKVGKVFFGLMLEGRQATRRRNSRGHAYRRLDTLEQAMSTSSTAPPSKIIY